MDKKGNKNKKEEDLKPTMCIVCKDTIWWDKNSNLPPACYHHSYMEVDKAYAKVSVKKSSKTNINKEITK